MEGWKECSVSLEEEFVDTEGGEFAIKIVTNQHHISYYPRMYPLNNCIYVSQSIAMDINITCIDHLKHRPCSIPIAVSYVPLIPPFINEYRKQ